jgi:glycosyltransferase involved in cell wall biosynthesis
MKIAFVTNVPSHFHTKLFETISDHYETDFFFFSDGRESWIEKKNELQTGKYHGSLVTGIRLNAQFRINFGLILALCRGGYDIIIHSINGRFELLASFLFAKMTRKPFILWTNLWFHPDTVFHRLTIPIVKAIYRNSDAIVCYGYHVRDYLLKFGVNQEKIFYSWNIADNERFGRQVDSGELDQLRKEHQLVGRRVVLFVGRLSEEKGLLYLLEAHRKLAPGLHASLLLVGRGPQCELLKKYVEDFGLEHVHFVDYVPNDRLVAYYALANVFVLPSVTMPTLKEVWGIVLNEAMNQGCPVVATDAVGAAVGGLMQPGKNGLVVPERDHLALHAALTEILSDDNHRKTMRQFTRENIKEWDYMKSFCGFRDAIALVTNHNKVG